MNTKPASTLKVNNVEPFQVIEFDHSDAKGRRIGAKISKGTRVYVAATEEERRDSGCWVVEPGTYYWAVVQATRNGSAFGASQYGAQFTSEAERDAYIARRVEESRKAAAKKARAAK